MSEQKIDELIEAVEEFKIDVNTSIKELSGKIDILVNKKL